METSEWAELKVRLSLGRDRALQKKRDWLEVYTSSSLGRHTKGVQGRTPCAQAERTLLETQQNPVYTPEWTLQETWKNPVCTA